MLHAACGDAGIGSGVGLTNNPCGLHSWGSVKVAGHVVFLSMRIHAGGRQAEGSGPSEVARH